jgi:hypothetical protein
MTRNPTVTVQRRYYRRLQRSNENWRRMRSPRTVE